YGIDTLQWSHAFTDDQGIFAVKVAQQLRIVALVCASLSSKRVSECPPNGRIEDCRSLDRRTEKQRTERKQRASSAPRSIHDAWLLSGARLVHTFHTCALCEG